MTGKSEQMDLCTNCLNINDCFHNKKESVHFCEEFTCNDPLATLKDFQRFERAEALFLPKLKPGLFDDCGKPAPQGN